MPTQIVLLQIVKERRFRPCLKRDAHSTLSVFDVNRFFQKFLLTSQLRLQFVAVPVEVRRILRISDLRATPFLSFFAVLCSFGYFLAKRLVFDTILTLIRALEALK